MSQMAAEPTGLPEGALALRLTANVAMTPMRATEKADPRLEQLRERFAAGAPLLLCVRAACLVPAPFFRNCKVNHPSTLRGVGHRAPATHKWQLGRGGRRATERRQGDARVVYRPDGAAATPRP